MIAVLTHSWCLLLGTLIISCPFLDLINILNQGIGASSLLSPLLNLINLATISLNLNENDIGDIGA